MLRQETHKHSRVYYRRRRKNVARKAGNVADFCRRWGSRYDHLLVLDADSLMESSTITGLAQRMQADPDAGLIQTIPSLINGTTLMARLQQFAARIYGPVIGTGLGWWVQKKVTSGAITPLFVPKPLWARRVCQTLRVNRHLVAIF